MRHTWEERAKVAVRLREQGKTSKEIAQLMGISRSYAAALFTDPTREADVTRKASYQGKCVTCGRPTDGSNGRAKAPTECIECFGARLHDERRWTRPVILDAINRFVAETGTRPSSTAWLRAATRPSYAPGTTFVLREFGTWNAAMETAGQPTIKKGGYYVRSAETKARMSAAQRRRSGQQRDYGQTTKIVAAVGEDQVKRLDKLNGCSRSEHVRRAIDAYLEAPGVVSVAPRRRRFLTRR